MVTRPTTVTAAPKHIPTCFLPRESQRNGRVESFHGPVRGRHRKAGTPQTMQDKLLSTKLQCLVGRLPHRPALCAAHARRGLPEAGELGLCGREPGSLNLKRDRPELDPAFQTRVIEVNRLEAIAGAFGNPGSREGLSKGRPFSKHSRRSERNTCPRFRPAFLYAPSPGSE